MKTWIERYSPWLQLLSVFTLVSTLTDAGFPVLAQGYFLFIVCVLASVNAYFIFTAPKPSVNLELPQPTRKKFRYPDWLRYSAFIFAIVMWTSLAFAAAPSVKSAIIGSEPTPLAGRPAIEGETVVVVAEFEKTSGATYEPHIDMLEVLEQAADEVGNVRVIVLDHSIQDRDEAQRIGDVYNATMVVYGRVAPGGVTVRYEIVPQFEALPKDRLGEEVELFGADHGLTLHVTADEIDNFETFLYQGMDATYILSLITGWLYYFDADFPQAISAFSTAEQVLDSRRASELQADILFYYRSLAYSLQGDFPRALNDINRAIEIDPESVDAHVSRGDIYSFLGLNGAALKDYNAAVDLQPDNAFSYRNRGLMYQQINRHQEAISDFERAIDLGDDERFLKWRLGISYREISEFEQAIAILDELCAQYPTWPASFESRGRTYLAKGDDQAAIVDFTRAIELGTDYLYYQRGYAYFNLNDCDKAIADFNEAISRFPTWDLPHVERASCYLSMSNYQAALEGYTRAIELNPEVAYVYGNRASVYEVLGEFDAALADLDLAIELEPTNTSFYYMKVNIHFYGLQNYEATVADYTQIIEREPDNIIAYLDRGVVEYTMQDYAAALTDFDHVISMDPTLATAYNERGLVYAARREYETAIENYDQAIALDKTFAVAYANRALAYFNIGNYDQALADAKECLRIAGEDTTPPEIIDLITWLEIATQEVAD